LRRAGRKEQELSHAAKSAGWKVELAAAMKDRTTATNRWLREALHMGGLHAVSRLVNAWPGKRK
jgi:putative transposase